MKINELLNKYFDGETSCKEERELRRFFAEEEVPEELQVYRPLFACLDQEAQKFRLEQSETEKKTAPVQSLFAQTASLALLLGWCRRLNSLVHRQHATVSGAQCF